MYLINTSAGSYTLTVTDGSGCSISAGPFVLSNIAAPTIDETNASSTNASCDGTLGTISGITANGSNLVYTWSNGGGNSLDATNLVAGTYTLTVEDNVTGCSVESTPYIISTNQGPTIDDTDVFISNEICNGNMGAITGITASGIGNLSFTWTTTNQQTIDITGLSAGSYTLTVVDDATGCSVSTGPYMVNYISGPTANFSYQPMIPVVGEQVQFTDQSAGTIVTWNWEIETEISGNQNTNHTFDSEGNYSITLTVVDQNGCTDTEVKEITVLSDLVVPNVITPNGDGINDLFVIEGLVPNSELIILNRWGNEIFNSSNYLNEWNGTDKSGLKVSEGVYTYILNTSDGKQKHGFVHVQL